MKRQLQIWEKDYLELSGFEVEVANDGETGLEKALKMNTACSYWISCFRVWTDLKSVRKSEKKKYTNHYGIRKERRY